MYLGEDPTLNRLVAVKVIHPHLTSNQAILERFAVEAKIAAALKSPHIVEIYDFGTQDGSQYFIMEHIEGHSLGYICNTFNKKGLPQRFCASVICQAAEGLAVAEKQNVVHRDIKPDNLLFNSQGVLKIADFGIVKIGNAHQGTMAGTVLGSPNYISPEQFHDEAPSPQSDIWALGVTFYYCLTGKLPFEGKDVPQIIHNVCTQEHESVLKVTPEVDPELSAIVDILLKKHPEKRGEGAAWLAKTLRQYLGNHGLFSPEEGTRIFIQNLGPMPNQEIIDYQHKSRVYNSPASITSEELKPSFGYKVKKAFTSFSGTSAFKNPIIWLIIIGLLVWIPFSSRFVENAGGNKKVKSVVIKPSEVILHGGKQSQVIAETRPSDAPQNVLWESNHPTIASVSDGIIYGLNPGKAQILAVSLVDPTKAGTCYVQVMPPLVEKVELKPDQVRLSPGESIQLVPSILPAGTNQKINWIVDKRDVVRLNGGKITAKKPGVAKVSIYSVEDPKMSASSTVIVRGENNNEPQRPKGKGFLRISSAPPHAAIYVNGAHWGHTPMKNFRESTAGRTLIKISHRSLPSRDTVINLQADENVKIHMTLE